MFVGKLLGNFRPERFAAFAMTVLLTACAVSRPTITQLTPDPAVFMVAHPVTFTTTDGRGKLAVPMGFVTDLASIPRALWWWQSPHEGTLAPAILHDYLYWEQSCTKDQADAIMYLAMMQVGMGRWSIERVYNGIRTPVAVSAWTKNTDARRAGESRFFTERHARILLDSQVDRHATLASLLAEAQTRGGMYRPHLPNPGVKAACDAAYREFNGLRDN